MELTTRRQFQTVDLNGSTCIDAVATRTHVAVRCTDSLFVFERAQRPCDEHRIVFDLRNTSLALPTPCYENKPMALNDRFLVVVNDRVMNVVDMRAAAAVAGETSAVVVHALRLRSYHPWSVELHGCMSVLKSFCLLCALYFVCVCLHMSMCFCVWPLTSILLSFRRLQRLHSYWSSVAFSLSI